MEPSDEIAVKRALATLTAMAEEWASEVGLHQSMALILAKPDCHVRLVAFAKQAFIDGAYRCFDDARCGKIPWLKVIQ